MVAEMEDIKDPVGDLHQKPGQLKGLLPGVAGESHFRHRSV